MVRDRSRSPRKDTKKRQRSRSRSRGRDQERKRRRHERNRSRSTSAKHNRRRGDSPLKNQRSQRDRKSSRSHSKDDDVVFVCEQRPGEPTNASNSTSNNIDLTERTTKETMNEDDLMMMKLMGFANFDTTKGKKIERNDTGTSRVNVKRKYRQYMNRVGGFNRPLDPVH